MVLKAKFFSSSYGGTSENYMIGISGVKTTQNLNVMDGILCVVQNILQRGKKTKLSSFLESKINIQDYTPCVLIDPSPVKWNVIKGDDKNCYNPAASFFDELLPKYMRDYSFIRQLILPEAKFSEILENYDGLESQQVDFYFSHIN